MINRVVPDQPPVIAMSQDQKDKWLAALRSGEYTQGRGRLYIEESGGYCCLGVLQKVISGDVSRHPHGTSCGTPDHSWLAAQNILFVECDSAVRTTNPSVRVRIDGKKYDPDNQCSYASISIAELNDGGANFEQIADVLEKIIEVRA